MATTNRTGGPSGSLREATHHTVGGLPSATRSTPRRRGDWEGEHWVADLVAVVAAAVFAGVTALGGLTVASRGPMLAPHERADVSPRGHDVMAAGALPTWGEGQCCHETR